MKDRTGSAQVYRRVGRPSGYAHRLRILELAGCGLTRPLIRKVSTLSEQFSNIVEHHLKPYSCREDTQSIFMRMAYDPKAAGRC